MSACRLSRFNAVGGSKFIEPFYYYYHYYRYYLLSLLFSFFSFFFRFGVRSVPTVFPETGGSIPTSGMFYVYHISLFSRELLFGLG